MSLLTELNSILDNLNIPVETGVFKKSPPDCYTVLTPLSDNFDLYADNLPNSEVQEVRISLFDKGNYNNKKSKIVNSLLNAEITITDKRYIGHEDDTGYHHYAVDTAKEYEFKTEVI